MIKCDLCDDWVFDVYRVLLERTDGKEKIQLVCEVCEDDTHGW